MSLFSTIKHDSPEPWGTFPDAWGTYFVDVPPEMDELEQLHNNIMFYLAIILFALNWIAISLVINFRNKEIFNKHMNHITLVELIWTINPALISILITYPSVKFFYFVDDIIDPAIVIFDGDYEWYWSYPYSYMDFSGYDEEVQKYPKEYPDHHHSLMDKGKGKAKATDLPSNKAINIMDKGKGKAKATKIPRSEVINIMDKGKGKAKATDFLGHVPIDILRKKVGQLPSIPNKIGIPLSSILDKEATEFPKHWGIGNSTQSTLQDGYVNNVSEYVAALKPYQGKTLKELNITLDKSAWPSRLNELTWYVHKCDPSAFLFFDPDSTIISPDFLHKAQMADVLVEFKNHSIKERESITLERANMEKHDMALKSIGLDPIFDVVGGDRFKNRRFWDSFPPYILSDIEEIRDARRNVPKKVKTVLTTHPNPSKWYHNHLEGLEKKKLNLKLLPKLIDNKPVGPKLPSKLIDNKPVGPKLPSNLIFNKPVGPRLMPKLFDKPDIFDNKGVRIENQPVEPKLSSKLLRKLISNKAVVQRNLPQKLIDNQPVGLNLPPKLMDDQYQDGRPTKLPRLMSYISDKPSLFDNKPVVQRNPLAYILDKPKLIDNKPVEPKLLPKLFDKPDIFDNKGVRIENQPVGPKLPSRLPTKLNDNEGVVQRNLPQKLIDNQLVGPNMPRLMPKFFDNQGLGVRHADLPQKSIDNEGSGQRNLPPKLIDKRPIDKRPVGPRKLLPKLIDNQPVGTRKLLPKLIDNNPQILGKRKR